MEIRISQKAFRLPGTFPNHIPNPEDETAMAAIQKAVLDNKADFGIIFDTDVDR
jgi:phosphomannomutase